MSKYRVVACPTCNKITDEWSKCYMCRKRWCSTCHVKIDNKSSGEYSCPHCYHEYTRGHEYTTPFVYKKPKKCIIC